MRKNKTIKLLFVDPRRSDLIKASIECEAHITHGLATIENEKVSQAEPAWQIVGDFDDLSNFDHVSYLGECTADGHLYAAYDKEGHIYIYSGANEEVDPPREI